MNTLSVSFPMPQTTPSGAVLTLQDDVLTDRAQQWLETSGQTYRRIGNELRTRHSVVLEDASAFAHTEHPLPHPLPIRSSQN